jgi:large repetitive protein
MTRNSLTSVSSLVRCGLGTLSCAVLLAACGGGGTDEANRQLETAKAVDLAPPSASRWTGLIPLSIVPASASNLPNGKVLLWSANDRFSFGGRGQTYTTLFDPVTQTATERLVNETGHDMFCSGTSNLSDGTLLVNGGDDSGKTSLYNPASGLWTSAANMQIARAYQGNTVLQDGSVFTYGGSWNGGAGNKHGEVWTAAAGWQRLSGALINAAQAPDPAGVYRGDNHLWLFPAPNGKVLHAGPSASMNWIDTQGNGSVTAAGPRGDDAYSQGGNAVMYDIGKVLKVGGAPAYDNGTATTNSYVIDMNTGLSVRKVAPMAYRRIFGNGVALPNGQVLIIGGQTIGVPFSDDNSALVPELWDPATEKFTPLPPIAVGRNYHSVALLLPDARVLSAGGGLCGSGCAGNHPDAQILTPHYLLNADGSAATRPVIQTAPDEAVHGTTIVTTTDSPIASFALVRLSSTTHTVNNDQRRVPLQFTANGGNTYSLSIPSNPGIVLPGHYMLFALNASGVPSVAKTIRISGQGAPILTNPGSQSSAVGSTVQLALQASPGGALTYAATDLPPGLSIDTSTGIIAGVPSVAGAYSVTISARNGTATTSSRMLWNIYAPGAAVAFVKLEALSEINGNPWTSMAEFNLIDPNGAPVSRTGWAASADSEELQGESGGAANAIDGNPDTLWHTQWSAGNPPPPHSYIVSLGAARAIDGFRYRPRAGGGNGTIAAWRFYTSIDGASWTLAAEGNFADAGDPATEKTVRFNGSSGGNRPPILAPVGDRSSVMGQSVSLSLSASDPDGDAVSYSAVGLPPGLTLDPSSGLVSGLISAAGNYSVVVQALDGRGGVAGRTFAWSVAAAGFTINPVIAAPVVSGRNATYTVSTNGGAGVRYRWNFGDGTPETGNTTGTTIRHAYGASGLYTVTVTATDANGNVSTLSFLQAVYVPSYTAQPTHSSNVVLESRTGANARVWLVNQDNDSVSVFDAQTLAKMGEVSVGSAPRSVAVAPDGRIWVANKADATISVISPSTLSVVQTIQMPRASMPFGVAFAPSGRAAYVTLEATGRLLKLNPTTGETVRSLAIGANPRHLAIVPKSELVLVSRFISPPLPGEGTANVQTEINRQKVGGEVVVITADMVLQKTIFLQHSEKEDSTAQGRGVPNYLAAAAVSPDGLSAWVPSKQDNVKRGAQRDGRNLDFQNTVRAISSRIDLASLTEDHAARVDHDNSGLASAAVFHPTGAYLFVALETSRHIAIIDPVRKAEIYRFNAGRAPQGLAVSADGLKLYVNNFMDRTLGVFDLTRLVRYGELNVPLVSAISAVAAERLTAQVLTGKKLFYDARDGRLARDGYMSCAACHNDGGQDGRTWDLTGLGEGLRNTISLRGRAGGQGFKHWSGNFDEIQDFEGQIRALAQGTGLMSEGAFNTGTRAQPLGDPKAGVSADLDALAAYVGSLSAFPLSPTRTADGALTAKAISGKAVFASKCASCHSGPGFTDSGAANLRNVGTLKPTSGQRLGAPLTGIDTPTLRDVWATGPYLHDGSAPSVTDAIRAHASVTLSDTQLSNVATYVLQIGSEEPGVVSGVRYVKFETLSELNGNAWTSMAEFNLLDASGGVMPRSGWTVSADSAEAQAASHPAAFAIDGNADTFWHTAWYPIDLAPPHSFVVNLGGSFAVSGFKYLPRPAATGLNGTVAAWRFWTSTDGLNWSVAAQGNFSEMGDPSAEKTVNLRN